MAEYEQNLSDDRDSYNAYIKSKATLQLLDEYHSRVEKNVSDIERLKKENVGIGKSLSGYFEERDAAKRADLRPPPAEALQGVPCSYRLRHRLSRGAQPQVLPALRLDRCVPSQRLACAVVRTFELPLHFFVAQPFFSHCFNYHDFKFRRISLIRYSLWHIKSPQSLFSIAHCLTIGVRFTISGLLNMVRI